MKKALSAAALVALLAAPAAFAAGKKTDTPLAPGEAATPPLLNVSESYAVTVPPLPAAQAADFDADDSTFNRPLTGCSSLSAVGTAVRYDLVTIQDTGASTEVVQVQTSDVGAPAACTTLDTFVVLYRTGPFNPASPLTNCARGDDDTGPGTCSQLDMQIPAGQTYILVVTTFDNLPTASAVGPSRASGDAPSWARGDPARTSSRRERSARCWSTRCSETTWGVADTGSR